MKPVTLSQTGVGSSQVIPIDVYLGPTSIGLGVIITGTVNTTVQHTFDNIWASDYDPLTGNWFDHPTLNSLTADADGNYDKPPRAVRLTNNSGAGTATLQLVQAGAVS
jgi:hypothetical protein